MARSQKRENGSRHSGGGRLGDEEFQRKLEKSQKGWDGSFAGEGPKKGQVPKSPKPAVNKKKTAEERETAALLKQKSSKPTYRAGTVSRDFLDDGISSLMGLPKTLDRTFYANVPDEDGRNAIFMATGGGFEKFDEGLGEKVKIKFVEIYFVEADEGNPLRAFGRKLDGAFVTPGQVHKNEVKKSATATEQMQEARRVVCGYLHDAWIRAGQVPSHLPYTLTANPPSAKEVGMSEELIQEAKEVSMGLDRLHVLAKEAAGEAVLALLDECNASASSNPKHFIAGVPGVYRFPRKGPATYVETVRESNGVVRHTVCGVEDGAMFPQSIARFRFTADQLAGKTNFPRRFMHATDMVSVAEREFISGFREFLKPYGLTVAEVSVKRELPKAPPASKPVESKVVSIETGEAYVATDDQDQNLNMLRSERNCNAIVFEGVMLSGTMVVFSPEERSRKRGVEGRYEVRVLSVPDNHPDADLLRQVRPTEFMATYFVRMNPSYVAPPSLKARADSFAALWRLLRRALGLSDGTALQTADNNLKGKKSA